MQQNLPFHSQLKPPSCAGIEVGPIAVNPIRCSVISKATSVFSINFVIKGLMTLSSNNVSSNSMLEQECSAHLLMEMRCQEKIRVYQNTMFQVMMDCHIWPLTFLSIFLFLLVFLQSLVLMIEEVFAWNLSLKVHLSKCTVLICNWFHL